MGLLPNLVNCKYFSRLDVRNAFHQIEQHPESRHITTFIKNSGIYRYNRLLFGINSAPEIFQKIFEHILCTCEGVFNYIDDVVVYAPNEVEHDLRLENVLKKLTDHGVMLNEKKQVKRAEELEFLGNVLTKNGIKPSALKVKAIKQFREPSNFDELRTFLGLITYLGKFIGDVATITDPLR